MGEMNESMVQQPQMMNAGVVDPNVTMGEQPQVSADQNVVATQNVGLMENDPFQERTSEPAPAIEVATGASIEEPQPIVEQQIAYNVNVDEVFEGGETKADEITKMVNDVVNNNASILSTPPQVPTAPVAPAPQEPVITLEPGPIAPEQVIALEPGPIAPQMAPAPIEPGVIPIPPVVEQPVVQQPIVPQQPVVQDIPAMPVQDPMMAQQQMPPVQAPVMTLEPGPIQNTNPFDGVQTNMEVPQQPLQPQMDFQQAEAAPLIDVAAPAPTPEVVQTPVVEQQVVQAPVVDQPVVEQPIVEQPIVPQQPVVQNIPAMPAQPEFSQAEPAPASPVMEQPITETPVVQEQPIVQTTPAEVPVQEPVQDEQPALSIDEQINQGVNETVVDTANLVSPEPQNPNPVPVPVNNPTVNPTTAQTINATPDNIEEATKTVILQSSPLGKVQPVAPIAVITELIDPPELTQKVEKTEPSVPQPVVEEKTIEEPVVEEIEEEQVVEEPTPEPEPQELEVEEEKVEEPIVEEKKEEPKKRPSIAQELDESDEMDLVIAQINKRNREENKTISLKTPVTPKKEAKKTETTKEEVNIEKELFVDVNEVSSTKKRSGKRKIIRGEEKFKSEKKVVPMEEDPLVKFCPSCGIIVSNDDIVCPECGDPIE